MTGLTAAREYIVLALMEAGSMYRDGAESFLAEYDAKVRAAALHEATALLGGAFWFDPRDREMAMSTLLGSIPGAPAVTPPCNCGHDKAQHDAGQCRICPGDSENTWQHPYTAAVSAPGGER